MSSKPPVLPAQQSRILRLLRQEGPLSRSQVHEQTGLRRNTVGSHVADLLERGFLCERSAEAQGPGRPRVPLSIDLSNLHVVGAAIRPGHVEACRLNLCGQALGRLHNCRVGHPEEIVGAVGSLFGELVNERTVLIGLSTTGFVDPAGRRILFSSALPGQQPVSLDPLLDDLGGRLLVIDNDMHALAARWMEEHHQQLNQDVLLVYFDDGQIGAALLVRGKPNRGCLVGGNELGHTRLPVETEQCYCGHTGCLERIGSTEFLQRRGAGPGTLLEHIMRYNGTEPAMNQMIELLATGLANPINLIRPHRVVLVSQYTRHSRFINTLMRAVRSRVMIEVVDRVQYHYWDQAASNPGEAAGWLALAAIYHPDWPRATLLRPEERV